MSSARGFILSFHFHFTFYIRALISVGCMARTALAAQRSE